MPPQQEPPHPEPPRRPNYYKPVQRSGKRRARWRDYRAPGMYMITINKAKGVPAFSQLRQAADGKVISALTEVGKIINGQIRAISSVCPKIALSNLIVMPDHVHFIINVADWLEKELGIYIGRLKGQCSRQWWDAAGMDEHLPVFEKDFNDRIIYKEGQLLRAQHYMLDNPRRLWLKQQHPDLFVTCGKVEIDGEVFTTMGNIFLLDHFDIAAVLVSSKFTFDELQHRKRQWLQTIESGGVLAGAFISEKEKAVRNYATENQCKIILFMDRPMPDRFKPDGKWFNYCCSGQLLILAPAEPYPDAWGKRECFLNLNAKAEALAAGKLRRL